MSPITITRLRKELDSYPGMLAPLIRAVLHINGYVPDFDLEFLAEIFRDWFARHEIKGHTKSQAAVHECGHVVAYASGEILLRRAEIYPAKFAPGCWAGRTIPDVSASPFVSASSDEGFALLARSALCGPIAEELLGGGDAMLSFTELLRARAFSDAVAEMRKRSYSSTWEDVARDAVATVEHYALEVRSLSVVLERRCKIEPQQPKPSKILRDIAPRAPKLLSISSEGEMTAQRIILETPCTTDFVKRGAR